MSLCHLLMFFLSIYIRVHIVKPLWWEWQWFSLLPLCWVHVVEELCSCPIKQQLQLMYKWEQKTFTKSFLFWLAALTPRGLLWKQQGHVAGMTGNNEGWVKQSEDASMWKLNLRFPTMQLNVCLFLKSCIHSHSLTAQVAAHYRLKKNLWLKQSSRNNF